MLNKIKYQEIFNKNLINFKFSNYFLFYLALLLPVIYLGPGIFPLDRIIDLGDSGQFVWDLWIVDYLLSIGKNPYFTDLAYWPVGVGLTHHTLASGYYPLVWIIRKMFGDQYITYAISYNLACWFSLSAVWFFTYKCLSRLAIPGIFALIAATAYAFSPFFRGVWMNLNHVSGFFLPLIAYYVVKIYQENNIKDLYILAIFSGLSVYFTEFIAFIALAIFIAILGCLFFKDGRERVKFLVLNKKRMINNFLALLLAVIIAAPFYYAFFQTKIPGFGLEEQIRYSTNIAEYFFPGANSSLIYPDWLISIGSFSSRDASPIRFLGYPLLFLSVFALFFSSRPLLYVGVGLLIFFLVLGMGPVLKVFDWQTHINLPYRFIWSHGLFPGFRTPERFNVMSVFLLTLIGGYGLTLLYLKARFNSPLLANFIVLIFAIWVIVEPIRPVNEKKVWVPEKALLEVQNGPVLHLPHAMIHGYIGLAQIIHKQPTLTGAVVRLSPKMNDQWWKLNDAFKGGEKTTSEIIKKLNVRNLILMPNTGLPPEMTVGMDQVMQTVAKNRDIKIIDARTPLVRYGSFEIANPEISNAEANNVDVKILSAGNLIDGKSLIKARQLEIVVLDKGTPYRLDFIKGAKSKGSIVIPSRQQQGWQFHIIELPNEVQTGFDAIRVEVNGGGYIKGLNFRE